MLKRWCSFMQFPLPCVLCMVQASEISALLILTEASWAKIKPNFC